MGGFLIDKKGFLKFRGAGSFYNWCVQRGNRRSVFFWALLFFFSARVRFACPPNALFFVLGRLRGSLTQKKKKDKGCQPLTAKKKKRCQKKTSQLLPPRKRRLPSSSHTLTPSFRGFAACWGPPAMPSGTRTKGGGA